MIESFKLPNITPETLTGSICSFNDEYGNLPLKSCVSQISGYQEGSGTPSPSNVRPLHAFSSANIGQTSGYGEYFQGLLKGTYSFVDLGSLTFGYNTTYSAFYASVTNIYRPSDVAGRIIGFINMRYPASTNGAISAMDDKSCLRYNGNFWIKDTSFTDATVFKTSLNGVYLIYELETPITPTITPEQFATLCQAFGITGNTYTFTFGQSIYQGSIDWKRGVVVGTWGYIASYNGETLTGEWLSDKAPYEAGTTPPTGSQVAYELATPIEIPLGGINLLTQEGQNNIFCDTGDTEVKRIKVN